MFFWAKAWIPEGGCEQGITYDPILILRRKLWVAVQKRLHFAEMFRAQAVILAPINPSVAGEMATRYLQLMDYTRDANIESSVKRMQDTLNEYLKSGKKIKIRLTEAQYKEARRVAAERRTGKKSL